eukprot:scaffold280629_cov36-Tisochrysis_lutea.AAC.8
MSSSHWPGGFSRGRLAHRCLHEGKSTSRSSLGRRSTSIATNSSNRSAYARGGSAVVASAGAAHVSRSTAESTAR